MIKSYKELSIGKYLEIQAIIKMGLDDIDAQVKILSVLTDMSEEELLNINIVKYKLLAADMAFLFEDIKPAGNISNKYKLGQLTLIPVTAINKMSTAQYIDFQTLASMGESKLVEMLSCVLVPNGCRYNVDYELSEVHDAIREHLSIQDCINISAFFLTSFQSSIKTTLNYLGWMTKIAMRGEKKKKALQEIRQMRDSLHNGAGLS